MNEKFKGKGTVVNFNSLNPLKQVYHLNVKMMIHLSILDSKCLNPLKQVYHLNYPRNSELLSVTSRVLIP